MPTRSQVRLTGILASSVLVILLRASVVFAQASPTPSLLVTGNSPRTEMVTIRRVVDHVSREGGAEVTCILPCAMPVPPGRYDVVSLDADLRMHHHEVDVRSPNTRVDVDFRAHSDTVMFGTGVGLFSFGSILFVSGLIMGIGGVTAQNTANEGSASLMAQCSARFSDPTAITACCLNLTGSTNTGTTTGPGTTTGSQNVRNQCIPQSFTADVAAGAVAVGVGVIGIIVGSVMMARSAHTAPRDSQFAARRRYPISIAFDSAVVPGGGAIGATLRF